MKLVRSSTSTTVIALGLFTAALAAAASTTVTSSSTSTAVASPIVVVTAVASPTTVAAAVAAPRATAAVAAVAAVAAPVTAPSRGPLAGVNISGGEFGAVPGRMNYQYIYPSNAEIDYFYANGMRMLRIPFRWERLQPTLFGPLSVADRAALKAATTYATSKGMTVVLDMHDYAARHAATGAASNTLVGTAAIPETALANAWTQIAGDYKDNPKVWLGLMNEPSGIAAASWWAVAQQLVKDLRAQKIPNKVMVPGASWTGAWSWISSGNAALAEKFTDPSNNFAFEVHQYLDKDSSGTNAACTAGSASRVDAVLNWAQTKKVQLFFGEIAGSADAQCQIEYPAMLKKLNANSTVLGWTAWGAGKWWVSSYAFRLAPITGTTPTAHMTMLINNLPK
jgi:endoglucanase